MSAGMNTIVYPVKDAAAAKQIYTALLGDPHTDQPYYVGYRVGTQEIGLDPNGHAKGMTGPLGYWDVDDIEASVKELAASGAQVQQHPQDVGGGKLIATLTDADGNLIGLSQAD